MFSSDILAAADGQKILGIVIGSLGWSNPLTVIDKRVLSWEVAEPMLNYEHDANYGGPKVHAITAWTADRVIFVHDCEGSTEVKWVPRNPIEHEPDFQ